MGNMSYCRFRNTLRDLRDCAGALETLFIEEKRALSDDEFDEAVQLVGTCHKIMNIVCDNSLLNESTLKDELDLENTTSLRDALEIANKRAKERDQYLRDNNIDD